MTEREEFEADVIESFGGVGITGTSLAKDKNGWYTDPTIADHWETWQTAWQAGRAPLLKKIEDLENLAGWFGKVRNDALEEAVQVCGKVAAEGDTCNDTAFKIFDAIRALKREEK